MYLKDFENTLCIICRDIKAIFDPKNINTWKIMEKLWENFKNFEENYEKTRKMLKKQK